MRTTVGRAFIAIRDADVAAESIGVNLTVYKTLAFACERFLCRRGRWAIRFCFALHRARDVHAAHVDHVPGHGRGRRARLDHGTIAGACLISRLDLQLRNILNIPYVGEFLHHLSQSFFSITGVSNIQYIIFGLILIRIMLFEPLGLFGVWIRAKKYWKTWPF